DELISRIKSTSIGDGDVLQFDDMVLARLDNYTIFAALKKDQKLKTEKLYLLQLFVLNAAKAIHNAELRETLLQKEKLSAVGKAMSMMMHDLRSPVKNIKAITQLMRDESKDSEMLDMIDECAGQASQIFEDFLDFVKETPVMKSRVNLGKIVDEGIKLAQSRNMNGQVSIRKKIPAN